MKRLVMLVAAGAAMAAAAMPTKQELQKAQAMVNDVTAADLAALKTKSKTPAEVAAKHMELAAQAGSEAEKYLLLQGAFKLYAKAGDYDAAANALGAMNREIADMNPEVIVEIYNKAIFSSMKEKAPKLFAIKETARRQVTYRKLLAKAEAAVKANPKDPAAQKKLGECHAELGNWPKALDAFALAGGTLAKTAKSESDGSLKPQELGDFWWDYESGDEVSTYKLHAAELYRTALADDSFKGLARTRTEQRVKECETVSADLPPVVSSKPANLPPVSLSRFDFRYAHHLHFHFNPCPAGKTKMNNISITVTRPFCLGDKPITRREWFAVRGEKGSSWKGGEEAPMTYVTYQEASDFADKLTAKFFNELPRGYVIRLPTAAEWCLAYQTGNTAPAEEESRELRKINFEIGWFGQGVGGTPGSSNMKKYYEEKDLPVPLVKDIWPDFVPKVLEKWDWPGYSSQFAPVPVGLKKANGLGLHDMYGNCFEMMLDCTDSISTGEKKSKFGDRMKNLYAGMGQSLTDPIVRTGSHFVMLGSHITPGLRGDLVWTASSERLPLLGFRLCVGPYLVAEKTANGPQVGVQSEKKAVQTLPPVKPLGARPADKKFNLAKGIDVEMIGCPAGEFIMGESSRGQEFFPHNVKISRPFWLSKTRVTFEQYETFKKSGAKEKELEKWVITEALGGRQCPVWGITYEEFLKFCEVLTRKHQGKIPKGYVFRPPTEAEWEYAYRTDATDENDPHCWLSRDKRLEQLPLYQHQKVKEMANAKVKAMGIDLSKMPDYWFPSPKVGTQPPNKWGICDLLDFGNELTFDTIDKSKNVTSKGKWHWHLVNPNNQVFHYELSETDPLKVFETKGGADAVTRYGMQWKFESVARWFVCRLCLGPDLGAEKKAKK